MLTIRDSHHRDCYPWKGPQLTELIKAISIVQYILVSAKSDTRLSARMKRSNSLRLRRSGASAAKLKKEVLAARKKGVSVAALS